MYTSVYIQYRSFFLIPPDYPLIISFSITPIIILLLQLNGSFSLLLKYAHTHVHALARSLILTQCLLLSALIMPCLLLRPCWG